MIDNGLKKCKLCKAEFKTTSQLNKHIEKEHGLTEYFDFCNNTKSVCMRCGNISSFNKKLKKPNVYCKNCRGFFSSQWSKWFYIKQGISEEEAIKQIQLIQQKNAYNGNKQYSLDILLSEGKTLEEAQLIVANRLKANPRRREHYSSDEEFKLALTKFHEKQLETFNKKPKGYFSCYSFNFYKYEGLTQEEKRLAKRKISYCKDNKNFKKFKNNTSIEYYINQGLSEEEAKQALHKRQSTFSKIKCIEKFGEELGLKRFNERQLKWKTSLLKKPENKEKIAAGQIKGLLQAKSGYSKIALELFKCLHKQILEFPIENKNFKIFYKNPDKQLREFVVTTKSGKRFLDFFFSNINLAIEFDGEYWHKDKAEQDKQRDLDILDKMPDLTILHIAEKNYINHKEQVINDLMKIIIERMKLL